MITDEIEYEVIDFNGEVACCRLLNGTYAVDPLYLEEFKNAIKTKETA
jgi:hypothetical protein